MTEGISAFQRYLAPSVSRGCAESHPHYHAGSGLSHVADCSWKNATRDSKRRTHTNGPAISENTHHPNIKLWAGWAIVALGIVRVCPE